MKLFDPWKETSLQAPANISQFISATPNLYLKLITNFKNHDKESFSQIKINMLDRSCLDQDNISLIHSKSLIFEEIMKALKKVWESLKQSHKES
jgi:hypothetical protein